MKYINCILFLYLLSIVNLSNSRFIKDILIYEKIESFDDIDFIYKKKIVNGKKENYWYINDEQVTKEEYKKDLLEAKQKEWQEEQEKNESKQHEEEEFRLQVKINTLKKILSIKIKEIDEWLNKIKELEENNLFPFFAFNEDTFASKNDFKTVENSTLIDIKKFLSKPYTDIDLAELNNKLEIINSYPDKLNKFFRETISNAIKLCDDTKMLRKLLELIT